MQYYKMHIKKVDGNTASILPYQFELESDPKNIIEEDRAKRKHNSYSMFYNGVNGSLYSLPAVCCRP